MGVDEIDLIPIYDLPGFIGKMKIRAEITLKGRVLFKQRYVTLLQLFNIFFITTIPRFGRLTGKNINPTLITPLGQSQIC